MRLKEAGAEQGRLVALGSWSGAEEPCTERDGRIFWEEDQKGHLSVFDSRTGAGAPHLG